jgi:amino acid transporter
MTKRTGPWAPRGPGGGGGSVPDTEDRNWRQEFRDRSFEVQKHVATLSTAASLLILAVYRERPFELNLLAPTLLLLAISALISIHGMTAIALYARRPLRPTDPDPDSFDRYISRLTISASNILTAAVVVFALFLFGVPFWVALGILGVLLVVVLLVLRRRKRRNINRARRTTSPRED